MHGKHLHDKLFILFEKFLHNFHHAYINLYEKMTMEEFQMVNIKPSDRVIHIGCGPIPNTLVILAKNIPANYIGIDRDIQAVEMAREIVKKYNLNIKVEYGDALKYPIKDFDVIIISFGVEPHNKIFERIKNDAKEDARIIYRKQYDFLDFIYGKRSIPEGFKVISEHKRRDMIKSYLLKKYS